MSDMQRLFIAIGISSSLLRQPDGKRSMLANVLHELSLCGRSIKPSLPENLHITLKFLGETSNDQVPLIERELARLASQRPTFTVSLRGLGVFPDLKRPAVCWAGLKDAPGLMTLAEDIEAAISPLGFARERRPFQPHLTLARVQAAPTARFFEIMTQHATTDFGTDLISELLLMRSSWPAPGLYRAIGTWPLQPPAQ